MPSSEFLPPPEGGGDWLRFESCPFPPHAEVNPWLNKFADASSAAASELLRQDWLGIRHPVLRSFADSLLNCHPVGLLTLEHEDHKGTGWLVLSRRLPSEELARDIANRKELWGIWYLAPSLAEVFESKINPDDLLPSFFIRFGGLRISPPFIAGNFHDMPGPPVEVWTDEQSRWPEEWRDAKALFVSDTGDELLINSAGQCAWLLHGRRAISPIVGSFADVLNHAGTTVSLDAYDGRGHVAVLGPAKSDDGSRA